MPRMTEAWIEHDVLVNLVRKHFEKPLTKFKERKNISKQEPTLEISRKMLLGLKKEEILDLNQAVATTKTFQNAIGGFHQDVLGHAKGWETTGANGGVVDLKSKEPIQLVDDRMVLAEVKMRFNTIKASDELHLWDKLQTAVKTHDGPKKYVAYLFQIVPKKNESYDIPWKVTGRNEVDYVRVADGVTAYHIVTGDPNALANLFQELPSIFAEAFPDDINVTVEDLEEDANFALETFKANMPEHSYIEELLQKSLQNAEEE